jgi:hypothetical protein
MMSTFAITSHQYTITLYTPRNPKTPKPQNPK